MTSKVIKSRDQQINVALEMPTQPSASLTLLPDDETDPYGEVTMKRSPLISLYIMLLAIPAFVLLTVYAHESMRPTLLRHQELPLFEPHMPTFTCALQDPQLPSIDAQADAWFMQSRTLESPSVPYGDEDYKQIVQLTQRATARNHWKATLNLASLYVDKIDPKHEREDAVLLVEQAMKLGSPAAYDRMGTYFMNGTGVRQDSTRAYAFWQKAARMGSPEAMGFLGDKLNAAYDSSSGTWWANRPVAATMLACSVGQGNGDAARSLAARLRLHPNRKATADEKQKALHALQQGTRLGCQSCAVELVQEFREPIDLEDMLVSNIDRDRSQRYFILANALDFDRSRRFPNLDKVVPLPPADLPPWNGDRDTLVNAALGVTPVPFFEIKIAPPGSSRFDVPAPFGLHRTTRNSKEPHAPFEGYWRPLGPDHKPLLDNSAKPILPGLYRQGEAFTQFVIPNSNPAKFRQDVSWEYWITTWGDREAVEPRAPKDVIRVVPRPTPFVSSPADAPCPRTGTWQPWVPADHPLAQLINQHWRQAWVIAGQPFPQPKADWWIDLPGVQITWHLMDDTPVHINQPIPKKSPDE